MLHTDHLHDIADDAISGDVRCPVNHQFAGSPYAAKPSEIRIVPKMIYLPGDLAVHLISHSDGVVAM